MSADGNNLPERIKELNRLVEQMKRDRATRTTRLRVDKRTHRLRFEHETEDSVEVVIEPKEQGGAEE